MLMIAEVAAVAAAGYAGLCLLVFMRQGSMVYIPDRTVDIVPSELGMPFDALRIPTPDGETIAGWFIPARAADPAACPTVLFCHGNAGDIANRMGTLLLFHRMGFNAAIFDYRGYGASTGEPDEQGTYTDAAAVWHHLVDERKLDPRRIVLYGRSLGGAVAAQLAEHVQPAGLILESTFTSASDMAARTLPWLPARLLCRFRYDTRSRIARAGCPVLIAHGPDDEMIPFEHGKRLYDAAAEPKTFVSVAGLHNDGGLDLDPAYQQALEAFIQRVTADVPGAIQPGV
jgi:fermentation-respiration switch protein FrsA (DUF1100 family)